jgi:hypothetical protein
MTDRVPEGDGRGALQGPGTRTTTTALAEREWALVTAVAAQRGESPETTAQALVCEGIARRVRQRLGRGPSAAVLRFTRRGA